MSWQNAAAVQNTNHIANVKQLESVTVEVTVNVLIVEIPDMGNTVRLILFLVD